MSVSLLFSVVKISSFVSVLVTVSLLVFVKIDSSRFGSGARSLKENVNFLIKQKPIVDWHE